MDREFWKNKRILLTGHSGFKGSWMTLMLKYLGAYIMGYSLPPPSSPSLFDLTKASDGIISKIDDIRNFDSLKKIINTHKPEIVIHMAAQSLVRYSYKHPVETYSTNIMGTVNVLESIRSTDSVRVALVITSDKCYKNLNWPWGYRETDVLGGSDPYSSSKGCAEIIVEAYRRSFFPVEKYNMHGTAIATARAGNVIGGGDWGEDRLIPDVMRSWLSDRPVYIRMPNAIRPWQYVLDLITGYLVLIEKLWKEGPAYSEAWNFGPSESNCKSVKWVLDELKKLWNDRVTWIYDMNEHPLESTYLKLDCSKTYSRLGWYPLYDIKKTLEKIVAWYKAYRNGNNMREYCLNEIKSYLDHELKNEL